LSRIGKRKQPSYRIVVTDQRNPREGAHLEIIGHYNPLTNPATITLKEDRAIHWLQVGAQPSDTAAKILSRSGIMEQAGREAVVWSGKQVAPGAKKRKAMESAAAAPPPAPAAAAPAPVAAPTDAPAAVAEAPAAEEVPTPEPTEEAAAAPEAEAQASE
jgi:small subunit ribosomal protein S16